jgi:hypothetical protein
VLGTPQFGDVRVVSNWGTVGTTAHGTGVASSASANTYGSVVECISAANNNQDSWGIEITVMETGASGGTRNASLDILVGGATDDVLISSLLCGNVYAGACRTYFFPVHVPSGLRVAAQHANGTGSVTARVGIALYGGSPPPFRVGNKVTTYGTKINAGRGQAVTPTASGGAASVTEMTASSTDDHFYFVPGFQHATGTITLKTYNIGIGVGASTEERIGTWWVQGDTGEKTCYWPTMGAWRNVPSGTRLTMLASNSGTNDTHDGLIYAVT